MVISELYNIVFQLLCADGVEVRHRMGDRQTLISLPSNLLAVLSAGASDLLTPLTYATRHGITPTAAAASAGMAESADRGAADAPDAAGDAAGEADEAEQPVSKLTKWRQRGVGFKKAADHFERSPVFEIECARLSFSLANAASVPQICKTVARIVCPEKDLSNLKFPNKELIRQHVIRLDMIHCLWNRLLIRRPDKRTVRFLSPDSSPQNNYEYLCIAEERMTRPCPVVVDVGAPGFNGLGGFEWERRNLPVQTFGRGEGSVATKVARTAHAAILECGQDMLWTFRQSIKGFVADQGAERNMAKAPFGDRQAVSTVINDLKHRRLHLSDERARDILFFPYSMDHNDLMHIFFNALE